MGLDALVIGEPSEPVMGEAREYGVNLLAGGHCATSASASGAWASWSRSASASPTSSWTFPIRSGESSARRFPAAGRPSIRGTGNRLTRRLQAIYLSLEHVDDRRGTDAGSPDADRARGRVADEAPRGSQQVHPDRRSGPPRSHRQDPLRILAPSRTGPDKQSDSLGAQLQRSARGGEDPGRAASRAIDSRWIRRDAAPKKNARRRDLMETATIAGPSGSAAKEGHGRQDDRRPAPARGAQALRFAKKGRDLQGRLRPVGVEELRRGRGDRATPGARPDGPRHREGRQGLHPRQHQARVDLLRLRRAHRRRHRGADLPDELPRRVPVRARTRTRRR